MSKINPLLASLPNWGIVSMALKPDGKPSKAPIQSNRFAYQLNELSTTDRFYALDEAKAWLEHARGNGQLVDLAFGLVRGDNILCVDIDFKNLGHSAEDLDFVLKAIVAKCGTFWEKSASGEGLHLYYIIPSDLELNYSQFGISEYNAEGKIIKGGVGLYMDKRYIVIVDAPCGGEIAHLNSYGEQAVRVANSRPKIDASAIVGNASCTQEEFDRALQSAQKSKHWWPGQDTGDGMSDNSHSAGDMALFKHIAIQVNYSWQHALEIFQQSPRYTPERIKKKNVNRDYFADEAKKACSSRYQEEVARQLILSTVQISLPPVRPAAPPAPPTKVAKPSAVEPSAMDEAAMSFVDEETGVVLSLSVSPAELKATAPVNLQHNKFVTSPVPLPKKSKKEWIDSWPCLITGEANPSNVDYNTPEGFIVFVTPHPEDLFIVKLAKLLMARAESASTSVDSYLLNALVVMSAFVGPKATNSLDGENTSLFASPRVINVGETGVGKTLLANLINDIVNTVPPDARPNFSSGLPVSGQAVHDILANQATGNGLLWYLPEVAELLTADATDVGKRVSPHLFEANKTMFITAADATSYGTPLPSMFSATKNRPAVQGIFLITYGDCTQEVFSNMFGNSAVRGTVNRGLFNLMTPKIPAWSAQLGSQTPARRRELGLLLNRCQQDTSGIIERLTEIGRGELLPGQRFSRLNTLRIALASPSDQPPIVEELMLGLANSEKSNVNARATMHVRSLLQTAAICDPCFDAELARYCVNPLLADIIIGLVTRSGEALNEAGGVLTSTDTTHDKVQDAVVGNIRKMLSRGLPSVHAHRQREFDLGFINKSAAIHNLHNHPSVSQNPNHRAALNAALTDLAEGGHYLEEVSIEEKAQYALARNGSWYRMNLVALSGEKPQ